MIRYDDMMINQAADNTFGSSSAASASAGYSESAFASESNARSATEFGRNSMQAGRS